MASKLHRLWRPNQRSPRQAAAYQPALAVRKSDPPLRGSIHAKLINEPNLDALASAFKSLSASSAKFRDSRNIYFYTINRLAKQKRFSSIEEILQDQKNYADIKHEGFAARLLRLYGVAGMFNHAHNLFDELPDLNCPRTTLSLNSLLEASVYAKDFARTVEIFREYPSKLGVNPDVVSYNSVIKALGELGLMDEAISMVDEMKDKGLEPKVTTFNAVVDLAYKKLGFLEGEKTWNLMAEKIEGLVPDINSYDAKLNGMVNGGMVLEAVELFEELWFKGLEPSVHSYNHLIRGFCDKGDVKEAKRWYNKLVDSRICCPDHRTFEILIKPLCDEGDGDLAFDLSKRMLGKNFVVDEAWLQKVVDVLVKCSKAEEAEELVKLAGENVYHQYNLVMPSA